MTDDRLMTRRGFVAAGAAFVSGCCGGLELAHGDAGGSSPKMKIGILSDIHVTKRENATTFEKALRWFAEQGVDGVLVTGDLGTKGTIDERILKALRAKDRTQAALIEAVKADLKII